MKITIVGAGPVGCYTALLLKHYGIDSLIIEEHKEVGKPVHCAGIVGREVFEDLVVPLSKKSVKNQLDGAIIYYNGGSFLIKREGVAYVIDRETFDKELSKGINIQYNTKFLGFGKRSSSYVIKTNRGNFYSDILIGADGVDSRVRKAARLSADIKYYKGVQLRIKTDSERKNLAEAHFKSPLFSWVIPEGDGVIRVGTLLRREDRESRNFIKDLGIKGEILDKVGGLIPMGHSNTVEENVALVGDAACQVKPLTGGGIYYGLKSAEILAWCIKDGKLASYDRNWKKLFGGEIRFGLLARRILENMSDKNLRILFDLAKENSDLISETGDFENHLSIFWSLVKDPRIMERAITVLIPGLLRKRPKVPIGPRTTTSGLQ